LFFFGYQPLRYGSLSYFLFFVMYSDYSQLICDSITIWRNSNSLMEDKILVVWNTINSELAATLGVSQDTISLIFNEMDID